MQRRRWPIAISHERSTLLGLLVRIHLELRASSSLAILACCIMPTHTRASTRVGFIDEGTTSESCGILGPNLTYVPPSPQYVARLCPTHIYIQTELFCTVAYFHPVAGSIGPYATQPSAMVHQTVTEETAIDLPSGKEGEGGSARLPGEQSNRCNIEERYITSFGVSLQL